MIEYSNDLQVIKRLVQHSEDKLFPRMEKRKAYLDNILSENPEAKLAIAEKQLNNQLREHIQILYNFVSYMESHVEQRDKQIEHYSQLLAKNPGVLDESKYVQALEKELLYEFRKKHNIAK